MEIVDTPVLYRPCKRVTKFDDSLKTLVKEMVAAMYREDGVGLAAPQVGIDLKLAVVDDGTTKLTIANPKIISHSKDALRSVEGCLSFSGSTYEVKRYEEVTVEYQDVSGNTQIVSAKGYLATVFQHEIDHLKV